ncbi:hypothetical protein Tsubulata_028102 [Turnera subulata]|uniref:Uncharacterized protein n=1 Tax=Turnera subulata TaxID=218843 RepID=A0A9Q0FT50_9ROSI|nr:hypothetical protein Tsubulata_044336 [Turnera subulata]KAJ4837549.1 hypothetical protein Tsubulata_028102 [Turnera subulata]
MAKLSKLTKLRSAIKRWPSFTKPARTSSSLSASNGGHIDEDDGHKISKELHAVYVGKSRRRYLLGADIICHPLFQELVDRSAGGNIEDGGEVVVACEVVLFEHLLWMLENGGSMEELAEFYTY